MRVDTLIYLVSNVKMLEKCVNGKLSTGGVAKKRERERVLLENMKEREEHRQIGEAPEASTDSKEQGWWFDKYLWGHVRIRELPRERDNPILSDKWYFVEDDFALFKNPEDLERFNKEKEGHRIIPRKEWNKYAVVIKKDKFRRPNFAVDFHAVERAVDGSVALEPGEKAISIAEYLRADDENNQAIKDHWTPDERTALRKEQFERRRKDNGWEEDWNEGK